MIRATKIFSLAAVVALVLQGAANGAAVIEFKDSMPNDLGDNTGSIIVKVTLDPDQVANALGGGPELGVLGSLGLNLTVDLQGDLNGQSVTMTATPLPFTAADATFFGSQTQPIADGGTFTLAAVDTSGSPPDFQDLIYAGNMIDLWKISVNATSDFVQGLNNSAIAMTVVGGSSPSFTAIDSIGDPALAANSLFDLNVGGTGDISVAIPEPSAFLFLALLGTFGFASRWKRRFARQR